MSAIAPQWWTWPARTHRTSPAPRGVVGEVDGVPGGAALDVHEQVEVQALGGEELMGPAAVTDPSQGVHLDVAHARPGGTKRTRRIADCPIFTISAPVVTVNVGRPDPTVTSMSNLTYTVIDAADSSLNKTSVLVTGETEALVVDAAFTRADGHRIVAEVLDSGKRLTTVVVTAGDPDFYFGAEVIADAFPEAVFLAPADVIEHIEHSYQGKLQAWAHLGPNLPTRLVGPDPADRDLADRRRHHDRGTPGQRPARRPVLVPLRAGVAVAVRRGAAVRGTSRVDRRQRDPGAAGRVDPRANELEALDPATSSPGHRIAGAPTDLTAITHTRDYLELFEKTIAASAGRSRGRGHRSWRPTRTPA